ncbi:MAG: proline--tRNA ligase, partial [Phototrophicaceae bacterium]
VDNGQWARTWWTENSELEAKIKEDTTATLRCYPDEQPGGDGVNFMTGERSNRIALFAKAY